MKQNSLQSSTDFATMKSLGKWILFIALIMAVLTAGVITWREWSTLDANSSLVTAKTISAAEFEQQYGLRVRLIGVTAGGGLVDFRLKVLDVEKAKQILSDPEMIPSLIIPEQDVTLTASPELDQVGTISEGGIYFILFENAGGAVEPGTPVTVNFGDFQLEPIPAQ